jgi:hypothetical protein
MTRKKIKRTSSDDDEVISSEDEEEELIMPRDDSNDIYHIYKELLYYCEHLILPLLDKSNEFKFHDFIKDTKNPFMSQDR